MRFTGLLRLALRTAHLVVVVGIPATTWWLAARAIERRRGR